MFIDLYEICLMTQDTNYALFLWLLYVFFQIVIEEENKFLKLLELLGHYQEKGSVIIFVDKQEHADGLLKDLMRASYPCLSLHGGNLQI